MLKTVSSLFLVAFGVAVLSVAGCDKKDSTQTPPPKNEASEQILRQMQEPQQRAREMEQQLLERDRQQREAVDRAS
ncbi:MAG: hypothetical protein ACRCWR_01285 [Saezia sp.]